MIICPYCGTSNDNDAPVCTVCGGILAANTLHLRQGSLLGRYELGKVLGQGGFGVTYAGRDTLLGRGVAVKELFPEGSSRRGNAVVPPRSSNFALEREKFLEEARTLAQFDHPSIVRVWDAFELFDTAYLVMEFLRGETLGKRMERPLSSAEVEDIARKLLGGLEQVHAANMLHRDIKPDNIYLTQDARAVLIDFGSARAFAEGGAASTHTRLVTPGYAPPEQYASSAKFGPYTDLYALGATLYHALSGKMPPPATDRMLGTALEPLPNSVPVGLRLLIERCMALEVVKRPQSVREVIGLLGQTSDLRRGPAREVPQLDQDTQTSEPRPVVSAQPASSASSVRPSAPTPVPVPIPADVVHPPGGNLVQAIDRAADGARLRLAAGKFALTRALEIKKSITLVGAGRELTRITGEAEGFLVYASGGKLTLEGLTLEHTGRRPADVLVSSTTLEVRNVRIAGGLTDPAGDGGNGLVLLGGADATLEGCISEQNAASGLFLSETARVFSTGSQFIHNGSCGIAFFGHSSGLIRKNICTSNSLHGVVVTDEAQPILEENTFERNKECGVAFLGRSRGRAFDNVANGNALHPFYVSRDSKPSLQGNVGEVVRK